MNADGEKKSRSVPLQFDPVQQSTVKYVTPKMNDAFVHGPHCLAI